MFGTILLVILNYGSIGDSDDEMVKKIDIALDNGCGTNESHGRNVVFENIDFTTRSYAKIEKVK